MKYYDLANSKPLKGSNGYQVRYLVKVKTKKKGQWKIWLSAYGIILSCIFLTRACFTDFATPAHAENTSKPANQQTSKNVYKPTSIQTVLPTVQPTVVVEQVTLTEAPSPTPSGYHYDATAAIKRIWGKDAPIGLAISSCESGTNPDKYHINDNGTIDFSVFQINTVHGTILDPEENIRFAYQLFLQQGTTPWNSSKHCWGSKL